MLGKCFIIEPWSDPSIIVFLIRKPFVLKEENLEKVKKNLQR
jgi:hypothetical protein